MLVWVGMDRRCYGDGVDDLRIDVAVLGGTVPRHRGRRHVLAWPAMRYLNIHDSGLLGRAGTLDRSSPP